MKGKLIKTENGYQFKSEKPLDGYDMACYPWDITKQRLSLKNCKVIENGYDLDELAREEILYNDQKREWWKEGFQKALEILGDKKFSEDDILKAFRGGWSINYDYSDGNEDYRYIKSIQQTEWDVEIVTKPMNLDEIREQGKGFLNTNTNKLKRDFDNCLILKRI